MGLKTNATGWACGYNGFGELGDGTQINRLIPAIFNCINVGINDTEMKKDVYVYPNPATETLNILTGLNLHFKKVTINDMLGKIILETNGNSNQIDISQLMSGMYLLKMVSERNGRNIRFAKK